MTILILFFWLFVSVGLFYGGYRANCYFGEKIPEGKYPNYHPSARNEGMQVLSFLFMCLCLLGFSSILVSLVILSVQLGY